MKPIFAKYLFILIIPASLFFLIACNNSTDPEIHSIDKAKTIVFEKTLNKSDSGKVVYKLDKIVKAGEIISAGQLNSNNFIPLTDSWFFFIDDQPNCYWVHDCRYVFVDIKTNKLTTHEWSFYPTCLNDMKIVKF